MITITPKIKKIIENNPIALATISGNKPYVTGVAYAKAIDQKTILISDNFMNSTVKNISKNNDIALVVWDKKWRGIQVLGKAKYYKSGKWLEHVKSMKENKGLPAKGAILIRANKIIESK